MTAVFVTHGRKYHTAPDCPRMLYGEYLHDWESWDDYGGGFTAGSYRREDPDPQHAAMRGKLPCLHCVPAEQRVFPPLYGQTFGHEPVGNDVDYWGETTDDLPVCARCTRTIRARLPIAIGQQPDGRVITRESEKPIAFEVAVLWPCTSAVVLGLAPRQDQL